VVTRRRRRRRPTSTDGAPRAPAAARGRDAKPEGPGGGARPRGAVPAGTAPRGEEARLLGLARDLARLADEGPAVRALEAALARLGAGAPRRPPGARVTERDEARALAVAWAREQVRLAWRDLLDRAARAGALRPDLDRDALAWLLLAAGDALAREPVEGVAERLRALRALLLRPGAVE